MDSEFWRLLLFKRSAPPTAFHLYGIYFQDFQTFKYYSIYFLPYRRGLLPNNSICRRRIIRGKYIRYTYIMVEHPVDTSSYQFVPLFVPSFWKKTRDRERILRHEHETERASGRSRARTRPRVRTASTQTILKASSTAHQHVHARPAVGITSTERGRKASPCKPGGRARPREIFET